MGCSTCFTVSHVSPLLEIGRLGLSERGRMEANRLMGSLETQKQTGRMFSQDALKNQKDVPPGSLT